MRNAIIQPHSIQLALKKIYEDLSSDDLLSRCLGANTQNNNEYYNATVWHLAPKHMYCGKNIVELVTDCAPCTFNEGCVTLLKIMETMGGQIGVVAAAIQMRANKSRKIKLHEDDEGILYGPGIAD